MMSEDVPSTSTTSHKSNSPKQPKRKPRKRDEQTKLPTPPPDPREAKKDSCTEKEFLDYLENLQKQTSTSRSTSTLASALIAEDAFDHLDKLYKLMEQMLELRSQNVKLHRRIRDLEHVNNLQKMYKEVDRLAEDGDYPELDRDTGFAETILESILDETKQPSIRTKGSIRQSLTRKRNRSSSAIDKPTDLEVGEEEPRRASLCVASLKKPAKVSKWTKVKAAFKWEKASQTVGDAKSMDSGIGGFVPPIEIARYLRVPSNDDPGHSPSDSGAAEISTPGTLSSASSNENLGKTGRGSPYEDLRSSDDEHSNFYSSHSKEDTNISPRSSQRSHKTPWARMRDMINTKSSVRKKSRLSTHSDEIHIDIEPCSDNDEVFEDNIKLGSMPTSNATSTGKLDTENEIPAEIRMRYLLSDDEGLTDEDQSDYRKISKWTRVKKAFLPALDSNVGTKALKDHAGKQGVDSIHTEINRNYRNLQKKLSLEFQQKLNEWRKIKQSSSTGASPTPPTNPEEPSTSNPAFMKKMEEWEKIKSQPAKQKPNIPMTSEENLPPEFKKKLQEWEKIKKASIRKSTKKLGDIPRWKSMQNPKTEPTQIEIPPITDEFKKKLDEWKQIKDERRNIGDKTPSPKFCRTTSTNKQEKELQWYEREFNKLEKEKQKYLEREERLAKLRKSVVGDHKKDILVHTPSGFYKFEGISKKFTQKLYEWEKSRGIGPESSTFAYLNPEYPSPTIPKLKINGEDTTLPLIRSRSMDSVIVSALNAGCPLISQPSSLSLSNMEELEKECLGDSSSPKELDEPEALIVEVEDFVEETAAPLRSFVEQHNPVYQHEEVRALCEGETCLAPKVRRSESARAQTNYDLIEQTLVTIKVMSENEVDLRRIQITEEKVKEDEIKEKCDKRKVYTDILTGKLHKLQDENMRVVSDLSKENQITTKNLEAVQDLTMDLSSMVEKLENKLEELNIQEILEDIKMKLLELRRQLSYICAASDSTIPSRKRLQRMKPITDSPNTGIFVKSETKNIQSQGAIKKRIRYRVENIRRKSLQDSDEDEDFPESKKYPKVMRTRTVSETSTKSDDDTRNLNIFPVVSKTTYPDTISKVNTDDSPVTIFVKTTRKLFTPIVESSMKESDELPPLPSSPVPQRKVIKEVSPSIKLMLSKYHQKISVSDGITKSAGSSGSASPIAWRSPTAERRVKAQTEKYQTEIMKQTGSQGYINKFEELPKLVESCKPVSRRKSILKSSSAANLTQKYLTPFSIEIGDCSSMQEIRQSSVLRLERLRRAKEEFLNSGPSSAAPQSDEPPRFPNRLSHISIESSSSTSSISPGLLVKSISAGMINIAEEAYKRIEGGNQQHHSLPRDLKGDPSKKSALSNLAAKFRKVRMRRGKDKEREKEELMTVTELCRQSLVVDISRDERNNSNNTCTRNEQFPIAKSSSWIKKTNFFRK